LTYAEIIALRLATAAMAGSVSAAAELADRAEGRPRQQLGFDRGDNIPALVDALNRCADQIDEEDRRAERAAEGEETTDK
jgi:HPt (histidine-containing phosphotransfer) domain-containing protein